MKKVLYLLIVVGIAVGARYAYKAFETPVIPTEIQQSTGEILTGVEMTWENVVADDSEMEEVTENIDTGEVPTIEGSEEVSTDTGVVAEVDDLIQDRETQPKDDTKLTEEDIDLMQQIIDKVQGLGK